MGKKMPNILSVFTVFGLLMMVLFVPSDSTRMRTFGSDEGTDTGGGTMNNTCVQRSYETSYDEVTWDLVVESARHGWDFLVNSSRYGKHDLLPVIQYPDDPGNPPDDEGAPAPTDILVPSYIPASVAMYQITGDPTYLDFGRRAALSMESLMLNEKGIARYYYRTSGADDRSSTGIGPNYLCHIAELAVYDKSVIPLLRKVANATIEYYVGPRDLLYWEVYPDGRPSDTRMDLPWHGTQRINGLLRTYQVTGDARYLAAGKRILNSLWNCSRYDLVPTRMDARTADIIDWNTQLYATGLLLQCYEYYYLITGDPGFKDMVHRYSKSAFERYWTSAGGLHYWAYEVDVNTGKIHDDHIEYNNNRLNLALLIAQDITGNRYEDRVWEDMNTTYLDTAYAVVDGLVRHSTGSCGGDGPSGNDNSHLDATFQARAWCVERMRSPGVLGPETWNDAFMKIVNTTLTYHRMDGDFGGYWNMLDTDTKDPWSYAGNLICCHGTGEIGSLITLMLTPSENVRINWERFDNGFLREPFMTCYGADEIGMMKDVSLDHANRTVILRQVTSVGPGKIFMTEGIAAVLEDGIPYDDWWGNTLTTSSGTHEYFMVLTGVPSHPDSGGQSPDLHDTMPPIADAGPDMIIDQHEELVFDGERSSDNEGITTFIWSFQYDGADILLFGVNPSFTFEMAGAHNVSLAVFDGAGNWDEDRMEVTVNDIERPTADAGPDQTVNQGDTVMFNGSSCFDNVGIVNVTWTFEDEGRHVLHGVSTSFVFRNAGVFQVELDIADGAENRAADSMKVTVMDTEPPFASAGPDQQVNEGDTVTLDASGSSDNVGISNYTWSFMYDDRMTYLFGERASFLFDIHGTYEINLTTTDGNRNPATDGTRVMVAEKLNDGTQDGTPGLDRKGKGIFTIYFLIRMFIISFLTIILWRYGVAG